MEKSQLRLAGEQPVLRSDARMYLCLQSSGLTSSLILPCTLFADITLKNSVIENNCKIAKPKHSKGISKTPVPFLLSSCLQLPHPPKTIFKTHLGIK